MSREMRIINAIDFIEKNLLQDITVDDIAQAACLSPRHLYRTFQRLTGDTLMHYVRSLRLSCASKVMIYESNKTMLDIALAHQFQSPEAFSRAFSQQFWLSPRKFKSIGSPYSATQRQRFLGDHYEIIHCSSGHPEIITRPESYMVGICITQPHYGFRVEDNPHEGRNLSDILHDRLPYIENLIDDSEWNVAFRIMDDQQPLHHMQNLFAVSVRHIGNVPSDLQVYTLPAHRYAIFEHNSDTIPVEFTVAKAFDWLSRSTFSLGDAPSMFHRTSNTDFSGKLYIPISDNRLTNLCWWQGLYQPN